MGNWTVSISGNVEGTGTGGGRPTWTGQTLCTTFEVGSSETSEGVSGRTGDTSSLSVF